MLLQWLTQIQQETTLFGTNSVCFSDLWHTPDALWEPACDSFSTPGPSCPSASRTAGTTSFSESPPRDRMETKFCVWRAARGPGPHPKTIQSNRHYLYLCGDIKHAKPKSGGLSRCPQTQTGNSLDVFRLFSPLSAHSSSIREHAFGSARL